MVGTSAFDHSTGSGSPFSLVGKVVLVTGASRGIGHALAQGVAAAGATCVGMARSARPSIAFQQAVDYRTADVSSDLSGLIADLIGQFGRVDGLINAAGVSLSSASGSTPLERFDRTLEINLRGAYVMSLAVAAHMDRGASIINVTSIGAHQGFPDNPGYVASKGGLRLLTKALAVDLGPKGIRVNALAPGYIHTDMTRSSFQDPARHAARAARTCLGRWGEVSDLIGPAIFLLSDASAYMTGQDLIIDGGWTAKGLS
jgi:gluconate 5-dehydrogenase